MYIYYFRPQAAIRHVRNNLRKFYTFKLAKRISDLQKFTANIFSKFCTERRKLTNFCRNACFPEAKKLIGKRSIKVKWCVNYKQVPGVIKHVGNLGKVSETGNKDTSTVF